MEELISIIVPIYNVERYLPRCIDSILAQSYRNLEIILVDDGSTDSCSRICDEYAEKYTQIRVIHKENGGLSDARNVGIEAANGMYLGFLDSDDYIHPEMYQRLWEELKSQEADIAMCNLERVCHENYEVRNVGKDELKIYTGLQGVKNILDKDLHVVSVVVWNKLYKKELFEDIRFPKKKLHEDEFTTYRLFYKSSRIISVSGEYYYYFQRADSIMGKRKKEFSYDALEAYEQMGNFFAEVGNEELLYLVKYKYLYMLKDAAVTLKKQGEEVERQIVERLDKTYKCEYKQHIHKMKGVKRKIRLWLYRWVHISI